MPDKQDRANVYALLAALLLRPDAQLVAAVACLPRSGGADPLALAWDELVESALRCGPAAALAEYDSLFVAAGTPRINPYECYYRDGWLMDKPLAQLREDLRALGLARAEGATELEDHLGALCESMRVLIERDDPSEVQHAFFQRHLADWSAACLDEIASSGADFYPAVARFTQAFFELESQDVATAA